MFDRVLNTPLKILLCWAFLFIALNFFQTDVFMRELCISFLSDFNLMSFVKTYSISFDVMYQISKKNIGAYSNITITKHYKFFMTMNLQKLFYQRTPQYLK